MDDIKTSDLAERDYIAGMKYKDIAEKYDVSINTVKSWKKRHNWVRGAGEKCAPEKAGAVAETQTEEEKNENGLNEKQQLFCIYYVKKFNATWAYQKAYGADPVVARSNGCKLLAKNSVQEEINRLKESKLNKAMLEPEDIIQKYIDIAFADIGDIVKMKNGRIKISADEGTDTSVIAEISSGKTDKVKMYDKFKALEALKSIQGTAEEETKSILDQMLERYQDADKY